MREESILMIKIIKTIKNLTKNQEVGLNQRID